MSKTNKILLSLLSGTLFTMVHAGDANAQVPTSAEPGMIIRDPLRTPTEPQRSMEIEYDDSANERYMAHGDDRKIVDLQTVVLEGSNVYTDADIAHLYEEFVGKKVSFVDLQVVANRITRKYREDGFVLSRAVISPQRVNNGTVRLNVVEGFISNVRIVGEFDDRFGLAQKLSEKVVNQVPMNAKDLERYLLLIDDLPGIRARSVLRPSNVRNASELIVTIEQDKSEASLSADNFGSNFLGRHRVSGVIAGNSLLKMHDRTTLRVITTTDIEELNFVDLTHEQQIGSEGGKVLVRGAITRTEPGGSVSNLDIEGDSELVDIEFRYPMIRSRQKNLTLKAGFTALNTESTVLGVTTADDNVRSVNAGFSFDFTDTHRGVTQIDGSVTQGMDILGATDDGLGRTRSNGEHVFTRFNVIATRIQDLGYDWSVFLSAAGQYSSDTLLASEEFTVGGRSFGRAYDGGEITGDKGASASVELRYGHPVEHKYLRSFLSYGFYDIGKVWNEDVLVGEASEESLASAGAGVRLNFIKDISTQFEVAAPLTKRIDSEGDDGDEPRAYFNVIKRW